MLITNHDKINLTVPTKDIKALAKLASTDETRPVMQALHVTPKYIEATDGYVMGWISGEYNAGDNSMTVEDYLIPANEIKPVLNGTETLNITDNKIVSFKKNYSSQGASINYTPTEGEFPNSQRLIDANKEIPRVRVTLNCKFLKRLLEAMELQTTDGANSIDVYVPTDPLKPVLITGGKLKTLIMPIKRREDR